MNGDTMAIGDVVAACGYGFVLLGLVLVVYTTVNGEGGGLA